MVADQRDIMMCKGGIIEGNNSPTPPPPHTHTLLFLVKIFHSWKSGALTIPWSEAFPAILNETIRAHAERGKLLPTALRISQGPV